MAKFPSKQKKLPLWIKENFQSIFQPVIKKETSSKAADAPSVEAVKLLYSKMKNRKD